MKTVHIESKEGKADPVLDLEIDRNRLDEEWLAQPGLRFSYGALLADARHELLQAKMERDIVEAELTLDMQKTPMKYGLKRVTDKSTQSALCSVTEFKKVNKAVVHWQHEVDVLEAAVSAIDHRRKALEHLVSLFMADYFAAPRAPEGAKEKMGRLEKRHVRMKGRRNDSDE